MKTYAVKTRFTFTGTFYIKAGSELEAGEIVQNNCGLVLGGNIHTACLPYGEADWDFPMHPDKKITSIKRQGGAKKHGQAKNTVY